MTVVRDRLQGSMIVVHGPPKVGKTQVVSRFPSPILWLATEIGHKYVPQEQQEDLIQLDLDDGWAQLTTWLQANRTKKKLKFKTICVDTISALYDMCMKHVCAKNNWSHPSDGPHGKGWNALKTEFINGLGRLVHIAHQNKATLIFIDHSKQDLIETATANIEKVVCAMSGQARGVVLPIPDHIWFLGYGEKKATDALTNTTAKRALFIGGSSTVEAGCRDPQVKTRVIMPLSKVNPYKQIVAELYGKKESK